MLVQDVARFGLIWWSLLLTPIAKGRLLHEPLAATKPEAVLFGAGNATWAGVPKIISWRPVAVVYEHFLTDEECNYVLRLSEPQFEPALLVSQQERKHINHTARTSQGAFLDSREDAVIANISLRLAHLARLPPDTIEPWQVMRYGLREHYGSHVDFFEEQDQRFFGHDVEKYGGQRIKTALMYLTTPAGGETVFPGASRPNAVGVSSCAHSGVGVRPQKGSLLLFQDVLPDGTTDSEAAHEACPVTKGEKVVVSTFFREHATFLTKYFSKRKWNGNVFCEDDHKRCSEWGMSGDCWSINKDTRQRMAGDEDWPGFCEKTCHACRPLEDTVVDLRRSLGQPLPDDAVFGKFMQEDELEELYYL